MRRLRWLVLGSLIALPLAQASFAADGHAPGWEAGFYFGHASLDDYATLDPENGVLAGGRLGYRVGPRWGVESSFQWLTADVRGPDLDRQSSRFDVTFGFLPAQPVRPFVSWGVGLDRIEVGRLDRTDFGMQLGGGLRWNLDARMHVRLDARLTATDVGGPIDAVQRDLEALVGVGWTFGSGARGSGAAPRDGDRDGDGVRDARDRCPDTPRGARVDARGCASDRDGDGIDDGRDRCPDTPPGFGVGDDGCPLDGDGDGIGDDRDDCAATPRGAIVDAGGCPLDSDGDGVPDGLDRCPVTPTGTVADAEGCPVDGDGDGVADGVDRCPDTPAGTAVDRRGCERDTDRDGVPDTRDRCPDTPIGALVIEADGCPRDTDGDGVWDGLDRCPGTPTGRDVDDAGCEVLFAEGRDSLELREINFESSSARLTPAAERRLDDVATALLQRPSLRIEVAGHTDARGEPSYNRYLSRIRADAVREYLVLRGVKASRLTSRGYGDGEPVADNATEAGRARNRRVELRLLDPAQEP